MDCKQFDRYLDDLMDHALSEQGIAELESHAAQCPECAGKLNATRGMMELFSEMRREIDVPLETQAAWRKAVKAEAAGSRRKLWTRFAGGIAAALVVALGVTFALKARPPRVDGSQEAAVEAGYDSGGDDAVYEDSEFESAEYMMVEADGTVSDEEAAEEDAVQGPMHEYTMRVGDIDECCAYIADLVAEYEGVMDEQRFMDANVACANLFIRVPGENAGEFVSAAMQYAEPSESVEAGGDYATAVASNSAAATDEAPKYDIDCTDGSVVSILLVLRSH